MAVQYRRNLTVPEGFPSILKSFTRETLRNQVRLQVLLLTVTCEQALTCTSPLKQIVMLAASRLV